MKLDEVNSHIGETVIHNNTKPWAKYIGQSFSIAGRSRHGVVWCYSHKTGERMGFLASTLDLAADLLLAQYN